MSIRTLLVDDEPLALERLSLLLRQETDVEIAGACGNGEEALEWIRSKPVDLLFLDIQMPERSGLQVVEEAGLFGLPATVFVTAYQEHAVRAFEMEAIDYLTKPVDPQRLRQTVQRVRRAIEAKKALLTQSQFSTALRELQRIQKSSPGYVSRLRVRDGAKDILVPVDSISWIEASDYYSSLHAGTRTFMLREPISELATRLDPARFLRAHRSAIINLDYVAEIYREGSEGTVVLRDGQRLRMSKTGRLKLAELTKL